MTARCLSAAEAAAIIRQRALVLDRVLATAGVARRSWDAVTSGRRSGRHVLARLSAVLTRAAPVILTDEALAALYRSQLVIAAGFYGLDPAAVLASNPRAARSSDQAWLAEAHARQMAAYVLNVIFGHAQARVARVVGVAAAAICLALKSVEDRRDDRRIDDWLDRLASYYEPGDAA